MLISQHARTRADGDVWLRILAVRGAVNKAKALLTAAHPQRR